MSDSFKIGNIKKGFDIDRIIEIEKEWIKKTGICRDCILQGCCHACAATTGVKNKLEFENYCNKKRMNFLSKIQDYIYYLEIK